MDVTEAETEVEEEDVTKDVKTSKEVSASITRVPISG